MRRRLLALVLTLPLVLAAGVADAVAPPDDPGRPDVPGAVRGAAAVARLGDRLPVVAAELGVNPGELRRTMLRDDLLWADAEGELLFVEPETVAPVAPAQQAAVPVAPLSATFDLHSDPGASRTVLLDFDGHDASGTAWGSDVVALPYSADGSTGSFSDAELTTIQEVWALVAEDFAPFDVDVTTEDPGVDAIRRSSSGDGTYGTRLVVTGEYVGCSSCGGVAYVGVYDATGATHDYYQPAWVFTRGVGTNAKGIAEAASHEVGHNLGLLHDGTAEQGYYAGHGDWAPIMGVGYYEPITQWSRGEYAGASETQDDLAVMRLNGAPHLPDRQGDTFATAERTFGSTVFDGDGTIGVGGDRDGFLFDVAGPSTVTVDVDVAARGPNLDARLELVRQDGAVVATADPLSGPGTTTRASGLDATLTADVGAGTYMLVVSGTGKGSPATTGYSSYGSLGDYALLGTIESDGTPPPPPPGNSAPQAVLTATPTQGEAPLVVRFDTTGSSDPDGDVLTRSLDPGDGSAARTGATPSVSYAAPGTYTARLTVTDPAGLSDTATRTITVTEPATQAPSAPTNVGVVGNRSPITVRFTDTTGGTAQHRVERRERTGKQWSGWGGVAVLAPGTTSTADAPGNGRFQYRVRAQRDGLASGWSQTGTVRIR